MITPKHLEDLLSIVSRTDRLPLRHVGDVHIHSIHKERTREAKKKEMTAVITLNLPQSCVDIAEQFTHEVVVAHHSILEAYAVLTRLPGEYRLTPSEAEMLLRATPHENAELAAFSEASIWDFLRKIGEAPASGGAVCDAFIIEILAAAGVDTIATANTGDFRRIAGSVPIVNPLA